MRLAKIKSTVLTEALEKREFFALSCYLNSFIRTDQQEFITPYNKNAEMWDLRASLIDYCANEPESEKLFQLAKELTGESTIDLKIINEVNL